MAAAHRERTSSTGCTACAAAPSSRVAETEASSAMTRTMPAAVAAERINEARNTSSPKYSGSAAAPPAHTALTRSTVSTP
ncbi:hypothetical protein P3T34_003547 [Kitasatospora sp. MAP12-44]|uniref:hypothetical protein n=1 Tax=Kitasatospora sp. MAP12-44 TaxID=3035099 RepID=UPI0024752A3E|nr:hypothetical protein [Kitasatospora sp. MAP12-44]MDH6111332.1 hypothetical protein [Kitasatospora sp. MAP12-44]